MVNKSRAAKNQSSFLQRSGLRKRVRLLFQPCPVLTAGLELERAQAQSQITEPQLLGSVAGAC